MGAALKIPEHLESEVVARRKAGASIHKITRWLRTENQLDADRASVSSELARLGVEGAYTAEEHDAEIREGLPEFLDLLDRLDEKCAELGAKLEKLPETQQSLDLQFKLVLFRLRLVTLRTKKTRMPPDLTLARRSVQSAQRSLARSEEGLAVIRAEADRRRQAAAPPPAPKPVVAAAPPPKPVEVEPEVGRNAPCPCGSGQKYKKCCWLKKATAAPTAASR